MHRAVCIPGTNILRGSEPWVISTAQDFYVMRQHAACGAPIMPCRYSPDDERLLPLNWEIFELVLESLWDCVLQTRYAEELDDAARR